MNKNDIVKIVAEKTGLTQKEVGAVIDEMFETTIKALAKGHEINFAGFGKFAVKKRAPRESINPRSKEIIKVPSSRAVVYKPSKNIKDAVNKK